LAGNYSRAYSLYSLMVLRDGSLLGFHSVPAATPSGTPPGPTPQSSAFYSLAPNANVWRQASESLNGILATQVTWASGPQGTQALYIGQQIVQVDRALDVGEGRDHRLGSDKPETRRIV
jgi:hypothetical protein